MSILTVNQTKLNKSRDYGYLTAGLSLSPANELGLFDPTFKHHTTCANAHACALGCLKFAGRNGMPDALRARLERTRFLYRDRPGFLQQLVADARSFRWSAQRQSLRPALRPNLLSDLYLLGKTLATALPDVQVYDYTKVLGTHLAQRPENYHLTYSYSERTTPDDLRRATALGLNIAVIFATPSRHLQPLPATVTLSDGVERPVLDGDTHDLRFLDPANHVVGLTWKGSRASMDRALAVGQILAL